MKPAQETVTTAASICVRLFFLLFVRPQQTSENKPPTSLFGWEFLIKLFYFPKLQVNVVIGRASLFMFTDWLGINIYVDSTFFVNLWFFFFLPPSHYC